MTDTFTGRPRTARLPEAFLAALRDRVDLVDVASDYTDLKPAGAGRLKGLCPVHAEKTPSFVVSTDSQRYHCFGCGADGDAISLLTDVGGLTFREAVESLAGRVGLAMPEPDGQADTPDLRAPLRDALNRCQPLLHAWLLESPDALPARRFLADRGFTADHAALWELGFNPGGGRLHRTVTGEIDPEALAESGMTGRGRNGGWYDVFHDRLLWPLRDAQGRLVGYAGRDLDGTSRAKYLNTRDTPLYTKHEVLFGLHLARRHILRRRQVILVEGYTDVMAMVDAGLENTCAPCGTAVTDAHADLIAARIGDGGEVVTGFDNDDAGRAAAWRTFLAVQRFTSTITCLDLSGLPGKGDPCDVRSTAGNSALAALVESRKPLLGTLLRADIAAYDLSLPEQKAGARDAVARRLAEVTDPVLVREYTRLAADWVGIEVSDLPARGRAATTAALRPTQAQPQPAARVGPSEAELSVAALLIHDPDQIEDACWYGGGSLAGVIGAQLAEVVEASAAMFPAGRPAPDTEDARVWNDAMFEVLDETAHPLLTPVWLSDPPASADVPGLLRRTAKARCWARLQAVQQRMDNSVGQDWQSLMAEYDALRAQWRELQAL
ncbi:DNA primase [Dietzia sp. 179-F 9C3 NHS]|uniref:DNA primase n=1 Tax=Dietzia sp. 179-F 9C3 NHS TaxID=3374295 RepID=UPI0038794B88